MNTCNLICPLTTEVVFNVIELSAALILAGLPIKFTEPFVFTCQELYPVSKESPDVVLILIWALALPRTLTIAL